tara:strand:+ start:2034 stop:2246 length:213 start_codon:yes stop_codon:yes gene_type:complete
MIEEVITTPEQDAELNKSADPYSTFREEARDLARKILLTNHLTDDKLNEWKVIAKNLIPKLGYNAEGTEI